MSAEDVPSPIDLRDPADASAWADRAQARPGRNAVFRAFAKELTALRSRRPVVLELGSGPGFLAEYLFESVPQIEMTLLDFSAPMHALARNRLRRFAAAVTFLERDFNDAGWHAGLRKFDAVITNQSVHELRHKRHAPRLHGQVASLLRPGGTYLVADHFFGDGGLSNRALFMTVEEQRCSLSDAGFEEIRLVEIAGSLVLHSAVRCSCAEPERIAMR